MSEHSSSSLWSNPDLVSRYLANVRGAVPMGIDQIEMTLGIIAAARPAIRSFLDLGCGQALLASALLEEHPSATAVLVDEAEAMLELAGSRLHEHRNRVAFVHAAFLQPGWVEAVPCDGGFDAVVSSFSLTAAGEERKRAIFREVLALLQPEGVFINIEHVSSATRWTQLPVDDYLIDAIFGEEIQRSPSKTRAEVAHEYYERAARTGATSAPLEVQCEWLREAGFESVECFLKMQELAVFGGQRPRGRGC